MKAVILAGGFGTRISEESDRIPKPMVDIGGKPIIWHVMKLYSHHGINDFIICLGYKGYVIKEYFYNYSLHMSDITIDMAKNARTIHQNKAEPWKITLVDTGLDTMTGGRLKRVGDYIGGETFCMTYGDGLSDVDISALIAFHKGHGKLATVTSVRPPGRFGALSLQGTQVAGIKEKADTTCSFINGGFFVLAPRVLDYISDDATPWETQPLEGLALDGELMAFVHTGFWQPMDTLREKRLLTDLWNRGDAPWKTW